MTRPEVPALAVPADDRWCIVLGDGGFEIEHAGNNARLELYRVGARRRPAVCVMCGRWIPVGGSAFREARRPQSCRVFKPFRVCWRCVLESSTVR